MTENYNPYLKGKSTKDGDKYTGAWYIEDNQTWFFIVPKEHENEADPYLYETREEPAELETITLLGKCYDAGAAAFNAGKPRVPALDRETMDVVLKDVAVGSGMKYIRAWIFGWDYKNLFSDFVTAEGA